MEFLGLLDIGEWAIGGPGCGIVSLEVPECGVWRLLKEELYVFLDMAEWVPGCRLWELLKIDLLGLLGMRD